MGIILSAIKILTSAYTINPDVEMYGRNVKNTYEDYTDDYTDDYTEDYTEAPILTMHHSDTVFRKPFDPPIIVYPEDIELDHLDSLEAVEIFPDKRINML